MKTTAQKLNRLGVEEAFSGGGEFWPEKARAFELAGERRKGQNRVDERFVSQGELLVMIHYFSAFIRSKKE